MSAQEPAASPGSASESDDSATASPGLPTDERERLRRWRLLLGSPDDEGGPGLSAADQAIDAALAALYNEGADAGAGGQQGRRGSSTGRSAGLGASAPKVARWLGDIRTYFPSTVV